MWVVEKVVSVKHLMERRINVPLKILILEKPIGRWQKKIKLNVLFMDIWNKLAMVIMAVY